MLRQKENGMSGLQPHRRGAGGLEAPAAAPVLESYKAAAGDLGAQLLEAAQAMLVQSSAVICTRCRLTASFTNRAASFLTRRLLFRPDTHWMRCIPRL